MFFFFKKRVTLFILFFLFSSKLLALNYYSYDFRDINASINFNLDLDAHSDKLPFNIFDQEWKKVPDHQKSNNAFGQVYSDIYIDLDALKIGVFGETIAQINMNDGFIELWNEAQKDFFQLLANKDIYKTLEEKPLIGKGNSYKAYGMFVQKVFNLYPHHYLSAKLKLNYAKELQYIKVNGYTSSEKFTGSLDYIYSHKNYISNANTRSDNPSGIGYGIDIEYIYNKENIYVYLGAFNIGSYIYWKNVTLMHYDFDSEVIYKGADGYNHYRPFGQGYYEYNKSFTQTLPSYYRASINYELFDNLAFGNNLKIYEKMYTCEPYINTKIYSQRYKIGYEIQSNTVTLGAYFKYIKFELSNQFSLAGNILNANCKISY